MTMMAMQIIMIVNYDDDEDILTTNGFIFTMFSTV